MVTVQGIRLDSVSLSLDEKENDKISGKYSLMSNKGKALASQSFNGYGDMKVEFSSDTRKSLNSLLDGVRKDISLTLGLEE